MDKILIAGGGYADIPLIEAARSLGLHVITSGNRPDELGHRHSDEYHDCDFSDREAITELARRLKVDAICPCSNDFSALSAAWAAEKLGLPGHDSPAKLETIMHKDKFHRFAREHGLPVASAHVCQSLEDLKKLPPEMDWPVIVKPVDMTGGKGISVARSPAELEKSARFAQKASRTPRFIVEEFLSPDSYHHNYVSFVGDGKVVWEASDNEHYWKNPYLVWGMSTPSVEEDAIHAQLRDTVNKITGLLDLKPGIFMAQHCVVGGKLKIVEMGRRSPGNLHGRMLELATGFDFSLWTIKAALGEAIPDSFPAGRSRFIAEHCVMAPANGRIKSIEIDPRIGENILEKIWLMRPGDMVGNYLLDKMGILLMEFATMEEMLACSDHMHEYVRVIVEES